MFRITETKNGDYVLEFNSNVEVLTEPNGMQTHFIYMKADMFEKMIYEGQSCLIDKGYRKEGVPGEI